MELSESLQKGLRSASSLDPGSLQPLLDASFRSLLSAQGDSTVLDDPELRHVDRIQLKQMHAALTTFILEAVRQDVDKSTISSTLEDLTFSPERTEIFQSTFQKHQKQLEHLLSSIGTHPVHITDVSWRLQYHIKNSQLDKVNEPCFMISLNTENEGAAENVDFSCSSEQLQDLLGKLKDAAKSMERASQM